MRLKVGLVVAAVLSFGAQSAVAGTTDTTTPETTTDAATSTLVASTTSTTSTTTAPTTTGATTTTAASTTTEPVKTESPDDMSARSNSARNEGPAARAVKPGRRGASIQVVPTPAPPPTLPPAEVLPTDSGSGRRVVYHKTRQRVWLVDGNENVVKTHLVSGRLTWNQPSPGTYSVFSRSIYTCMVGNASVCWRYMVRFTYGPGGLAIGFHEIPTNLRTGNKLQSISQLGTALSAGCVRQAPWDAKFMWDWAWRGTKVVVIQ